MKGGRVMDLVENSLLALSGLRANKMRTVLTMLGIIIGISSVITIVTIGNSVNKSVVKSMSDIGANKIEISVSQNYSIDENGNYNYEYIEQTENDMISEDMIKTYKNKYLDRVDSISLKKELDSTKVSDKDRYANISVVGVNDGFAKVENIKILQGRFVTQKDMDSKKKLAVVSDKFIQNMYQGQTPIGKEIAIPINKETNYFTIIGVYEYKVQGKNGGAGTDRDLSTPVFLPISTVKPGLPNFSIYQSLSPP